MRDHGKLVKVVFEYEDGAISTMSGPPAQKWIEEIDGNITMNAVRYSTEGLAVYPWVWTTGEKA